ncbi:MAG: hypothetical protein JKY19_02050 [Alcanivoracaceae bacterium]|nr:hypothetical protein [Alcanivoracaceae bacterium]
MKNNDKRKNAAFKQNKLDELFSKLKKQLDDLNFFSKYWEKQRLYINHAYSIESSKKLFNVENFDSLLTSGSLMNPHLDIVENGSKMESLYTNSPSPTTDVLDVLNRYKTGATIRVPHIELFMPDLQLYCKSLENYFGIPIRANLYMTPPFSQGFQPHFDLDDILVFQAHGKKIWSCHTSYSNSQPLPNRDMTFNESLHRSTGIPDEIELNQGDMLYLPRGFMHEARTEEQDSIHITFAFIGNYLGELMQQMIRAKSIEDVSFRNLIRVPQKVNDEFILDQFKLFQSEFKKLNDKKLLINSLNYVKHSFDKHRNPQLKGGLMAILNNEN